MVQEEKEDTIILWTAFEYLTLEFLICRTVLELGLSKFSKYLF